MIDVVTLSNMTQYLAGSDSSLSVRIAICQYTCMARERIKKSIERRIPRDLHLVKLYLLYRVNIKQHILS